MEAELGRELLLARPLLPSLGLASVLLLIACLLLIALRGARKGSSDDASGGEAEQGGEPEEAKPRVTILFGTQTGTAERFAKHLRTELLQRYGDSTDFAIEDVENYAHQSRLPGEHLVLFLLATYGDGEPTDNALEFYNWVTAAAKEADGGTGNDQLLKDVSFGVFGLGNKQYEHFAAVGKQVHKALRSLGAAAVVRRGDGDDDADIDEDFDNWRGDLIKALDDSPLVGVKVQEADGPVSVLVPAAVPAYAVNVLSGAEAVEAARPLPGEGRGTGLNAGSPFTARVLDARELHGPTSDRSCLHVELDITGSQITYEAGDHIAVYAENSASTVAAAAECLDVPLDAVFTLALPDGDTQQLSPPFQGPISLRRALALHADVLAPAHRETLVALAAFAADASEAARLRHLVSPEGKAEYTAWVAAPSRSVLEVMQAFPSARPSLGAFFGSIAPRLQPRFYSISSAPAKHPGAVHITCAIVHDTTPTGRRHEGIASFSLKRAAVGASVPVYVRHSSFRLPPAADTPVVMVGPGTGLAPFRGFLQSRAALQAGGEQLGPALLYFGCRRREEDFIYQQELAAYEEAGIVSRLSVAFSREKADKEYVQHLLQKDAEEVWALLEAGGYVYVCGDAKHMARDVHRALIELVQRQAKCSGTQAEAKVKALADSGRYQRDVW